jgi:hypothetical protein
MDLFNDLYMRATVESYDVIIHRSKYVAPNFSIFSYGDLRLEPCDGIVVHQAPQPDLWGQTRYSYIVLSRISVTFESVSRKFRGHNTATDDECCMDSKGSDDDG